MNGGWLCMSRSQSLERNPGVVRRSNQVGIAATGGVKES
jgi:hypothetical protein